MHTDPKMGKSAVGSRQTSCKQQHLRPQQATQVGIFLMGGGCLGAFMTSRTKLASPSIQVTSEDRQRILTALLRRNAIRRGVLLSLLDIKIEFQREIKRLETHRYMALLEPFLIVVLHELGGNPGIASQTIHRLLGTQVAQHRLFQTTGIDQANIGLCKETGCLWYIAMLRIKKVAARAFPADRDTTTFPNCGARRRLRPIHIHNTNQVLVSYCAGPSQP